MIKLKRLNTLKLLKVKVLDKVSKEINTLNDEINKSNNLKEKLEAIKKISNTTSNLYNALNINHKHNFDIKIVQQLSICQNRVAFLEKVGGIEENVFMKINGEEIKAIPENDVDRTSANGKASSVQFIHFEFDDSQIAKFNNASEIEIGINHKEYSHMTKLSDETIKSLSADFNL